MSSTAGEEGHEAEPEYPLGPTPDAMLVDRLRRTNFTGLKYDLFAEQLVRFGYGVCLKWIKTGKIRRECLHRGRPIPPLPDTATHQDHCDLATDAAVEGANLFRRDALIGGVWSPDGGASLTTYYIGACIQVYPGVFRRWHRQHRLWMVVETVAEPEESAEHDSPPDLLPLRMLLEEAMQKLLAYDERAYTALTMRVDGHSYARISEVLKCSERAVEGVLRRGRLRIREILKELGGPGD